MVLEKEAMTLSKLLNFKFPEFTVTIGSILLVIYFCGVLVSAFRLTDRLWLVHQFLQNHASHTKRTALGHAMPTAAMSSLVLNWNAFDDAKKETWANNWLPIHPIFAWEALLVELMLVLNWWNPLAYRYRAHWAALFESWQDAPPERTGYFSSKLPGLVGLTAALGVFFYAWPANWSPTHRGGAIAGQLIDKTIFENKTERPHSYIVEWGGQKIPLTKFANPNGYSAELELELTDFKDIVNKPFTVFKDGNPIKPGVLSIFYKSKRSGTQAYINGIDPKKIVLLDRKNGLVFNDSLDIGDVLTLFGDTEDIYLSKFEVRIIDPDAGYEPLFFVPQINHLEATMSYQIVARKGQRTLVKIDPDDPNNDRIVQLYRDARQYEILEIPGFRTNRHYLTEAESLASKVAAANTTLTIMEKDGFYLPEYQSYQGKDVRMIWGEMVALPSSVNYPLDSFLLSIVHEPQLLVGEDTLSIVSFQVILVGKNRPSKSFWTYRTGDMAVNEALRNVQDESSVFFEKIVVLDEDGNRKLFPASFAFNIGNSSKSQRQPTSSSDLMLLFGEKTSVQKIWR